MNVCVESLYSIDGNSDKRRTMAMIRVMKGAVNLSKGQTGDVVYRYNRYEKKMLDKQLISIDKGMNRAENNTENQKRDILRKWSLVFGQKRAFSESIKKFDQMLTTAIGLRDTLKHGSSEDVRVIEKPLHTVNIENSETDDTNLDETVSTGRIDNQRSNTPRLAQHIQSRPAVVGRFQKATLPPLSRRQVGFFANNTNIMIAEELEARRRRETEAERRKVLPTFEKSMINGFLIKQHKLHEDLLTRNVLWKMKTSLDTGHPFYKHRLKAKLPDSASSLVQKIERERTESRLNRECNSPYIKTPRSKSGNVITERVNTNNHTQSDTLVEKSFSSVRPRTVYVT